jgi:hypothetical protein
MKRLETVKNVRRPEKLEGLERLQNHVHVHALKTKESLCIIYLSLSLNNYF